MGKNTRPRAAHCQLQFVYPGRGDRRQMLGRISAEKRCRTGNLVAIECAIQLRRFHLLFFPRDHLVQPLKLFVDLFDALLTDFELG